MNRLVQIIAILLVTINPTIYVLNANQAVEEVGMQAPWPIHEWSRTTPEEQGLNSAQLESMIDHFTMNSIQIDSLLVIRNGWIVFEKYPSKYGPDDLHHLFSCTKSVISTLVGIAFLLGYIDSIDEPVLDFFQQYNFSNPSERKERISIKDLLEMTTGFEWNEEQYGNELNDYNKMVRSEDWVK